MLLNWNCRGFDNSRIDRLKVHLGFLYLFTIDGIGRGRGLTLLWAENVNLNIHKDDGDKFQWMLTYFYGPSWCGKDTGRLQYIELSFQLEPFEMDSFRGFNELLFHNEKVGGAKKCEEANAFF